MGVEASRSACYVEPLVKELFYLASLSLLTCVAFPLESLPLSAFSSFLCFLLACLRLSSYHCRYFPSTPPPPPPQPLLFLILLCVFSCFVLSPPVENSAKLIFGDPLIVLLIFGGMVRFMAGYAIGSYLPDFYSQIYPDFNTTCELESVLRSTACVLCCLVLWCCVCCFLFMCVFVRLCA